MKWAVYILRCGNGSYYVGHTHDVAARYDRHVSKSGAMHTAQNGVERLIYSEMLATKQAAVKRELQIKRWSRAKKAALIAGDMNGLRSLSQSQD